MAAISHRVKSVSEKPIHIFDDMFSEEQKKRAFNLFAHADYTFLHASRQDTTRVREWSAEFAVDDFRQHWLHDALRDIACEATGLNDLSCYDVFCNASRFGDQTFIHTDSTRAGDISVLYYVNTEWEPDWAGETIFLTDDYEPELAVGMKTGRVLVFGGDVLHRAGLPSRI
ncbi:hypothetical protein [Thalassovita aquimarina]|uniref:Prolyl 4-hydroxylase alpha subunit Fe(2+) 2OG dioxygenase domain-containing protein n=1 Tax=Thalassovita aquimarina TaxID=2785917 RepID=A0ABS5HSE2_9RHOB|nr:hypothetical protein [Thalassovita aquimarina]MBR9651870.1 hypothetical protein [Thalassovita aquimarina]